MKKKTTKDNNRVVNIIITIGIIFLILSLVLMLTKKKNVENHIIEINYNEYVNLIKEDKYQIILLTSPTCTHCKEYKPYVNYVADENNLQIYNLNINNLNYDEYMEIHDLYNATKNYYSTNGSPSILTPTTLIIKNGHEVDSISGNIGYSGLLNLLKKNKIVN